MGERTRALIGTPDGVATVHVYSANPKTEDGYNAFIFRRDVSRSWRKLVWASVIDARGNPLPEGIEVGDKSARYTADEKRRLWAFVREQAKTQFGLVENTDLGQFSIGRSFANEVQCHAISTRRELEAVSSARVLAQNLVHFAASANEEKKAKKPIKYFEYGLAKVRLSDGLYLLMGEVGVQVGKRPYYDQRIVAKFKADSEVTFLHEQSRIGESAFERIYDNRFRLILQGVELYELQKSGHVVYNRKNAISFLSCWLADKSDIVLVTGRSSYEKCGAAAFLSPFLSDKRVTHLTTVGENPQIEDVKQKQSQLPSTIDAFIAVGGGTVIDTTKLLRAFSGIPFLAVPTTAGTGAEATRFAVYYDHGKKCSADDLAYLPTDQVLIPEFCESASSYQKACCAFDAYAQAVESLWAKRATDESQSFARKALSFSTLNPQPSQPSQPSQLLSSYYAGRAIDISRTTAAHAFSYYMTSTYGVPHGEAVYMMFPYICRANGHEEYIRTVPELRTLDQFIAEKNLNRAELIDNLFENVNPARLGNNPVEVRKESFNG